ncbi:MAG: oligosaccharide flippase family protein [Armatimonadetes bacterium]|nr:oligosaccharide flippase family protein [Armatimonadota bacterium]
MRRNVIANFASNFWAKALAFIIIPVQLTLLGAEAYGLVGFFATLQVVLGTLDFGLSGTVNREMARLAADEDPARSQRNLLRTFEIPYWLMAGVLGLAIVALAPVISARWVNVERLPQSTVTNAIRMMGVILVFQIPFALYQGVLYGLLRHSLLSAILIVTGTLRSVGVLPILIWVSPSVTAFFIWQMAISIAQTAFTALWIWGRLLHDHKSPASFDPSILRSVWRFTAGMTGISLTAVLWSQSDKMIVSKALPLDHLGYYCIASAVASLVTVMAYPVSSVALPYLSRLHAEKDEAGLNRMYHAFCQLVSVVSIPLALMVALESHQVMSVYTRSAVTAANTFIPAAILSLANLASVLVLIPNTAQLAFGHTRLIFTANLVSLLISAPLTWFLVGTLKVRGAATAMTLVYTGYLLIAVPIMYRLVLRGELWRWWLGDIIRPAVAAFAIIGCWHWLGPHIESRSLALLALGCVWLAASALAVSQTPLVRREIMRYISRSMPESQ